MTMRAQNILEGNPRMLRAEAMRIVDESAPSPTPLRISPKSEASSLRTIFTRAENVT